MTHRLTVQDKIIYCLQWRDSFLAFKDNIVLASGDDFDSNYIGSCSFIKQWKSFTAVCFLVHLVFQSNCLENSLLRSLWTRVSIVASRIINSHISVVTAARTCLVRSSLAIYKFGQVITCYIRLIDNSMYHFRWKKSIQSFVLNNGPPFHCLTTFVLVMFPASINTTFATHQPLLHHSGKLAEQLTNLSLKAVVMQ